MPPSLPSRGNGGPPSLPSRGAGPDIRADPRNFAAQAERISTRDVERAAGRTEGVWFAFDSTNVEMAMVEPEYDLQGQKTGVGIITIRFINGWEYEYPNRPMGDWLDLIESQSKGRFTYYEVRGEGPSVEGHTIWPYSRKSKWIDRTAEEIARMVEQREPRTAKHQERTYTRGGKRQAFGKGGLPVRFG